MKRLVCDLLSISLSLLILFGSALVSSEGSQTQKSTPNEQYLDPQPYRSTPSQDYGILI